MLTGYTFLELLSQKGATELWDAERLSGERVILHITPIREQEADEVGAKLQASLELAKTLRHKNILRVLGGGVEGSFRYVVSEHAEGIFLDRVLDACRSVECWPSVSLSTYIVAEVAKALAYVHHLSAYSEAQLIHHELCPAGIMIERQGGVKVVELGTQISTQSVMETAGQKRSGLIAYTSPELATDQRVDHRSDVFALGAIAWELLAKRPLFHRATDLETLEAVRSADIPPLPSDCPEELQALVRACLSKDPTPRPENAEAMLDALEPLLSARESHRGELLRLLERVTSSSGRPKRSGTFVFSQEEQAPQARTDSKGTLRSDPPSEVLRMAGGAAPVRGAKTPALPDEAKDPFFDAVRDGGGFENERFEILGRLGAGGMGEVYRVRDHELGEIVALKVIQGSASAELQSLERLRREVRLARKIASEYVCRIYDIVDLGGGKRGLMMALVEGTPLSEMMKEGLELDHMRFARWGAQIAEGLSAAHALSIIHRDLKPENIMVRPNDAAILLDFGIARSTDKKSDASDDKLTQAGIIMGTPLYMSPEQLSNRTLDGRSDLYSLGLIMAELITGEVPAGGANYSEILERRVLKAQPYRLNEIDPSAPWPLAQLIDGLLSPAADERPADAGRVAAGFQAIQASATNPLPTARGTLGGATAPEDVTPPAEGATLLPEHATSQEAFAPTEPPLTSQDGQDRQQWWIAIGLLALIAVALAIFVVRRRAPTTPIASDLGVKQVVQTPPEPPKPPPPKASLDAGASPAPVSPKKKKNSEVNRYPPAEEM